MRRNGMKKITLGLIASLVFLPVISFAQSNPQAPASWIAFQKEEHAKQSAFFQQLEAERTAFLNANPDVKSYLDQMKAATAAVINTVASQPKSKSQPGIAKLRTPSLLETISMVAAISARRLCR